MFGHHLVEYCRDGNILACPSEEWWTIIAAVIADVPVDVMSPASSHTAIVATPELLLEHHA
jgi:hypothetical protein